LFKDSVYLNVPAKLISTPTVTDITCFGANDGIGNTGISGGSIPYQIQWLHNSSTNAIETGLSAGVYYFTVTDTNACFVIDSVTITNPLEPLDIDFTTLQKVKCNSDTNAIVIAFPKGGDLPYVGNWVTYPVGDTLYNVGAGIYTYTLTDGRGCSFSKEDTITEAPVMDFMATILKQIYCTEDSNGLVLLSVTGGEAPYNFVWNFAINPDDTVRNVTAGNYLAIVVDNNLCADSVYVNMVASNPEYCGLVVPNGFSPNGDGKNDYLFIRGLGGYPENELTIFNRWGETVYHAVDYKNDWDGKPTKNTLLSGSDGIVPNDTYFYILYTKSNNKTVNGYVYITK
jgi:gliding motility-associated-like protein